MTPQSLGRLFWDRVARSGEKIAQRVKTDQAWRDVSWRALGEEVREVALGLVALGRQPGDAVGLLSQTRGEWVRADFAILSMGGVTIPVYPTYPPETLAYIVRDSEARTLFVEDQQQLRKAIAAAAEMPSLESVVLIHGSARDRQHSAASARLGGAAALGRGTHLSGALDSRLDAIKPGDVATIVYTSGTTGSPKGVVQTHANHLAALDMIAQSSGVREGDVHLLFLPLAHSFARMESFLGIRLGLTTAFAESLERLPENLREVSPDFLCSVPRVFEKVYAKILSGVAACTAAPAADFTGPSAWGVAPAASSGRAGPSRPACAPRRRSPTVWCSRSCARHSAGACASAYPEERRSRRRSRSSFTRPASSSWRGTG